MAARDDQDPKRRAKADQVLSHPWMRENGSATSEPLDNIILKRMQARFMGSESRVGACGLSRAEGLGPALMFRVMFRVILELI